MSVQISYKNNTPNRASVNTVLFIDEKFNTNNLKKFTSSSEFNYIKDLLKTSDLKKKVLVFDVSSKKKIVLISVKKDIKSFDVENLGAEFFGKIN